MSALRQWMGIDPVIFGAFALIVLGLFVVLGWQLAAEDDPVRPRVFRGELETDDSRIPDVAGTVSERLGDVLIVQDPVGPVDVRVPLGAVIQTLQPEEVAGVEPGDWVLVGGLDDNVNSFIVAGVVVVDGDGVR